MHGSGISLGQRDAAIELSEVRFAWNGDSPALAVERLVVARGERVFLRGSSGSGKSTLLGLASGVLVARRGTVRVLGVDLAALGNAARDRFRGDHIGFVFQLFNLVPYLSVYENVALSLHFSPVRARRLAGSSVELAVRRLLEALGLPAQALLARPVRSLSVGQQQRVAAARALLGSPDIILADEPTSALDVDTRSAFVELLNRECAARGTTLVFVSHDASLEPLFDRTISMAELGAS